MDKTILTLLFNYKGKITNKEFKAAIILLFLIINSLALTNIIYLLNHKLLTNTLEHFTLQQVLSNFNPTLLPIGFIITYSSVILIIKRTRALGYSMTFTIISSIINYLFFASVSSVMKIILSESYGKLNIWGSLPSIIVYSIICFLILGIINLFYLSYGKNNSESVTPVENGRLNINEYIFQLGKLLVIALIIGFVISALNLISKNLINTTSAKLIVFGTINIGFCVYYLKITAFRLKDSNTSIIWLISIFTCYTCFLFTCIYIGIYNNKLFPQISPLLLIATNIFIALQYVPFLLPTIQKAQKKSNYKSHSKKGI